MASVGQVEFHPAAQLFPIGDLVSSRNPPYGFSVYLSLVLRAW